MEKLSRYVLLFARSCLLHAFDLRARLLCARAQFRQLRVHLQSRLLAPRLQRLVSGRCWKHLFQPCEFAATGQQRHYARHLNLFVSLNRVNATRSTTRSVCATKATLATRASTNAPAGRTHAMCRNESAFETITNQTKQPNPVAVLLIRCRCWGHGECAITDDGLEAKCICESDSQRYGPFCQYSYGEDPVASVIDRCFDCDGPHKECRDGGIDSGQHFNCTQVFRSVSV